MMHHSAALLLLALCPPVEAAQANLCYNYGCAVSETVAFSNNEMKAVRQLFAGNKTAADERTAISQAMGLLLHDAGTRTPIHNDKGGNYADDGVAGRMDCIDHSHTTTSLLDMLQEEHVLKFHQPLDPVVRAPLLVNTHWAAEIKDTASGEIYVVDTWFRDNGQPAVILPLAAWKHGAGPDEDLAQPTPQHLAQSPQHE